MLILELTFPFTILVEDMEEVPLFLKPEMSGKLEWLFIWSLETVRVMVKYWFKAIVLAPKEMEASWATPRNASNTARPTKNKYFLILMKNWGAIYTEKINASLVIFLKKESWSFIVFLYV